MNNPLELLVPWKVWTAIFKNETIYKVTNKEAPCIEHCGVVRPEGQIGVSSPHPPGVRLEDRIELQKSLHP
jgi:hypothetical protein